MATNRKVHLFDPGSNINDSDFVRGLLEDFNYMTNTRDQSDGNGPTRGDLIDYAWNDYQFYRDTAWQEEMYAQDRAWQEDMYERYQSIGGQIDQMRENGLNPALMYGQGASSPSAVSSGQIPSAPSESSGGSSRSPVHALQQVSAILGSIMQFSGVAANLGDTVSQAHLRSVQAENIKTDTQLKRNRAWFDEIDKKYYDLRQAIDTAKDEQDLANKRTQWHEIVSAINVRVLL